MLYDPTVTQVTNAPIGSAYKTATLYVDADGNGIPSAGDTLLYGFEFSNTGNTPLEAISTVDIARSEHDTGGRNPAAQPGNDHQRQHRRRHDRCGRHRDDCAGVRVRASFLVTINNPLPEGVTQVSNQAQGFSYGYPTGGSDDPGTATLNDPP